MPPALAIDRNRFKSCYFKYLSLEIRYLGVFGFISLTPQCVFCDDDKSSTSPKSSQFHSHESPKIRVRSKFLDKLLQYYAPHQLLKNSIVTVTQQRLKTRRSHFVTTANQLEARTWKQK